MFIIIEEKTLLDQQSYNQTTSAVRNSVCYVCSSDSIITDYESGEVVCSKCGLVISDKIQESRVEGCTSIAINTISAKNSTGLTLASHVSGLSTVIGRPNRDASGHILNEAMRYRMERLRKWDFRIKASDSRDGNLKDALNQLHLLKDKLGLPETIVEKTTYIYRKAQMKGFVRGRTVPAVLDAALYIACRELGIPKTLKEIAGANNIKHKILAKSYRVLVTELDIKIPIVDPTKCVMTVSNKANLSEKTKRKAIDIMCHLNRNEMTDGKDPMGIAAAVLYLVCQNAGEKRTQPVIAQAAGITEMTLRNRYKDIKRLDLDLMPYLINK
ncbi:MAG: TFIIB-type zinc ribbon-containing protein [Candidatus Nitrosopolaris sp.]